VCLELFNMKNLFFLFLAAAVAAINPYEDFSNRVALELSQAAYCGKEQYMSL